MTTICFEESVRAQSVPTPEELSLDIPQTKHQLEFILDKRRAIEAILNGVDQRHLLIVGPCSIHDEKSALDYAARLAALSKKVSHRFLIVMRTYFEKPRTTIGWKGMLLDPHLDGSYDMATGVRRVRELLAEITDRGLAVGSEVLEMTTASYYTDYLSWGCIGARTSSSPPHRQLAATLPFPMGFKNTIEGNVDIALQGIISANSSHVYLGVGVDGQVTRVYGEGNPSCHLILRGTEIAPNYHTKHVKEAAAKCRQAGVLDKVLIDCSHDNCFKEHINQIPVFESVMQQIQEGESHILGMMLESHLNEGTQELAHPLDYGVSITDPCLDWETTEALILSAAE